MTNSWTDKFYKYSEEVFKKKALTRYVDGGGYSLIGEYKDNFKRRMGVGSKGNQVPFFKFIFDEGYKFEDSKYAPLSINVGLTTRVKEGTEIRYMLNNSNVKRLRPIDLVSIDDFYIGSDDGKVYERKGTNFSEISLSSLYSRMYEVHTSDVVTLKGVYRRTKLLVLRKIPCFLLSSTSWILGWLTYLIKRDRYTYDVIVERYTDRRWDREDVRPTQSAESNINFFGYKVSLWTIYTYSLLAIVIYLIWKKSLISFIPEDSFGNIFVIVFAIFTIVTYDQIIPYFLRLVIKSSAINSFDLKYKSLKLKI